MSRFDELLAGAAVGASFSVTAEVLGMDPVEFDGFVDSILNSNHAGFVASRPHRDSTSVENYYVAVLITRTSSDL
ncbi:hypothetical protein [Variovorax sp. UMC13]|uniref:hypothetical protein n=1 Tax=Variovorax sp. UMC13 TaxID=1862326 RepID=UPI0015FF1C89|nr:hypothetical protein [Variovorax sp. UMC13]MBB1599957.1 hypothetical protein [Variovorax sp. UMC13]